ncbi:MAG: hypothetical protein IH987_07550 [Planctomycetes bacterium]|nr:hypothetical protein [Planctomycetota bacterium]
MILEVPLNAAGTYVIAFDPDPNESFMTDGPGAPIPVVAHTPACITVLGNDDPGRCCSDIGPNVVCEVVSPQVCSTRPQPRSFATGETCGGGNACPTCVNDGECDDGDTCTADTCDETGQCGHTIICTGMRFYPIRMAPLGSPVGTVGYSVTPEFNSDLGCWELEVLPGVEVDIDVQAGGWGNAPGNPSLGAVTARLNSAGYSNGVGPDLNPKGWPGDPVQGAYQANRHCGLGGDLRPCVVPFDTTCNNSTNGFCIHSSDWVFTPAAADFAGTDTSVLGYGWFAAPSVPNVSFDPDPSSFSTLGGLILEIPHAAQGTYVIDFDPDSNNTFMLTGSGDLIPGLMLTAVCITVAPDPAKNRYLTFLPREPGPVAYKLDMVSSLFHPDAVVSGWIGAPDAKGIASLEPDPVTRDWTEAVVDVTGCEITPVAEFELRASADGGATFLPPVTLKTADQPIGNKWWGDLAGDFNGTIWTAPQGVTNFNDVIAIQVSFQGLLNAPGLPRVDVAPQEPNRIANVDDVLFVIFAFKGEPYPFGCPGDPCHDKLISPCP